MNLVEGMNLRTEILEYSLKIENLSSIFLSELLDIKDYKKSKSFGNTSGNLSFNQKIEMLIDIQALEPKVKNKFITFMSIRNQFMHNIDANSFENCFKHLDGRGSFLLKTYPQDKKIKVEEQLGNATRDLVIDLILITKKLSEKVKEKTIEIIEKEILEKYQKGTMSAISDIEKSINSVYDDKIKKGEKNIDIEEFNKFGSHIRSVFYKLVLIKEFSKKK